MKTMYSIIFDGTLYSFGTLKDAKAFAESIFDQTGVVAGILGA